MENLSKKAWDEESQNSVSALSLDRVEPFDMPKNKKITRMNVQLKQFKPNIKVVRVHSVRRGKNTPNKSKKRQGKRVLDLSAKFTRNKGDLLGSNSGESKRSVKRTQKRDFPPLPINKVKSSPSMSKLKKLDVDKLTKLEDIYKRGVCRKYFDTWKSTSNTQVKVPKVREKLRHKKKVSEFVQKPFSLLLINQPGKGSNYNLRKSEVNKSKEEEKQPKIDINYKRKGENEPSELSKSAVLTDLKDSKSKRKRFVMLNIGDRSKNPNVAFIKSSNKEGKKQKKQKTKQALKKYNEITMMLEKIQREATNLGKEYEKKKKLDHQ